MKPKPFLLLPLPAGLGAAAVVLMPGLLSWGLVMAATQTDIIGPAGSGQFGKRVTALPNGNIVVTDPLYDEGAAADVGAVYLYSGASGALISKLTGSTAGNYVGLDGVTVLSNGHYVVSSPSWDNGATADAGAVTWGNGTTGVTERSAPKTACAARRPAVAFRRSLHTMPPTTSSSSAGRRITSSPCSIGCTGYSCRSSSSNTQPLAKALA